VCVRVCVYVCVCELSTFVMEHQDTLQCQ